tara:strand:- start:3110 stop:3901 length:792 start_codon:yes stop_codon:yes gene_type:complete
MSIYSDFLPSRRGETQEINVIEYSDQPPAFALDTARLGEATLAATPYYLDMHRWIGRIWYPHKDTHLLPFEHKFFEMVLGEPISFSAIQKFVKMFGDFFSYDVVNNRAHAWDSNAENWRTEWRKIADAAINGATDDLIAYKLDKYTKTVITPLTKKPNERSLALEPYGWAGLCWAFIARDKFDSVTYTRCPNPRGCDREIPSSSPFGGNKQKTCSSRCRQAKNRSGRNITDVADVNPVRKTATNFQDVSADMQEWLRDEDRSR